MEIKEIRDVLCSILAIMREQTIYLQRQHGWLVSLGDAAIRNPEVAEYLKQHPFFDQGPRRDAEIAHNTLLRIDALILKLSE